MNEALLPVMEIIPELKEKLRKQNTIILQAPPGAGKSTVLPLQLLDESWLEGQKILILEPRRLAARSVAQRMAHLLGEHTGETVGYRIRFENETGKNTRIEVLTEGILIRMLQNDNGLEGVGLIIFDEFHERSLQADLALALSREVQSVLRDDLRLLIMSATLDGEELSRLLGDAPVLTSTGRQYPVTIRYHPPDQPVYGRQEPLPQQVARAVRRALQEFKGDVLAFLPGAGEIQRTRELLVEKDFSGVQIYPLYGDLPQEQQQQAIMPDSMGRRKVVLATSVAETSLTIEGIEVVVDCGYARVPRFDPRSGLTRLETVQVTADTAAQRAGRAGRLGPGVCLRLWSEATQLRLVPHRQPEIMEADLAPAVLELANWGVQDIQRLAWLTPPPAGQLGSARQLLENLQAVTAGKITDKGKALLGFPAHPRLAEMLRVAQEDGKGALAADIAALLEERDPLKEAGADLGLRIEALRRSRDGGFSGADRNILKRVERLSENWRRLLKVKTENSIPADEETGKLLAAAYPERVARREEGGSRYRLAGGRLAQLPEHDPLMHKEWLAVAHMDAGRKGGAGRIFLAASIDPQDLICKAREFEVAEWNSAKGELIARREIRFGEIVLQTKELKNIPEEDRVRILSGAVRKEGLHLLNFSEEVEQWQARVLSLRSWRGGDDWPDVSTTAIIQNPESWLSPYLQGVRKKEDFYRLNLLEIFSNMLSWPKQQQLEKLAPEKVTVPTGSSISLKYKSDGSAPVLAVRLQEMFGLFETPAVNEGKMPVLIHLLSPAYRPVQVTQDLRSFWQNTYANVRKDLRGRYPKHYWPEDPFTAEAVRGVKKRPK